MQQLATMCLLPVVSFASMNFMEMLPISTHSHNPSIFICVERMGASEALTPEDIEVDWLGGYWKLPNADMMLGWQRRQPQTQVTRK